MRELPAAVRFVLGDLHYHAPNVRERCERRNIRWSVWSGGFGRPNPEMMFAIDYSLKIVLGLRRNRRQSSITHFAAPGAGDRAGRAPWLPRSRGSRSGARRAA